MRSVVVVLPASMWAMMPMFLVLSRGNALGTLLYLQFIDGSDFMTIRSIIPQLEEECRLRARVGGGAGTKTQSNEATKLTQRIRVLRMKGAGGNGGEDRTKTQRKQR